MKFAACVLLVLGAVNAHEVESALGVGAYSLKKSVINASDSDGPYQTLCGVGTWRKEIGDACLLCPIGFFQDQVGAEDNVMEFRDLRSQCKICNEGFYTNEEGFSKCAKCPSGFTNTGLYADNRYMLFDGKVGKQDFEWVDLKVPTHQRLMGFDSEEEITEMRKAKGEDMDLEKVKQQCAAFGECNSFCFNKDQITVYYNTDGEQPLEDAGTSGWSCYKKDGQKEAPEIVLDGTFTQDECEYECSKDIDCMAFDYNRLKLECTKRSGVCFTGDEVPFKGDEDSCIFHCPAGKYWDGAKCVKETPGLVYCGCKQYFDSDENACKICPDKKFSFDQHHQMDVSHCQEFPEADCPKICGDGKHWDTVLGCVADQAGEQYCSCRQYALEEHSQHEWNYSTPTDWVTGFPKCGGQAQSPINIVSADAESVFRKDLTTAWQNVMEEDEPTKVMVGTLDTSLGTDGMDTNGNDDARTACDNSDTCMGYCASPTPGDTGKARYFKAVNAQRTMEYVDATNTAITYDCYVKMNSVQSVWDDENFKPASGGLSGRKIAQNGVNEQVDGNFGSFYDYKVKQFNFHSPSEHTIDGTAYDAEMHIVFEQDADHLVVFAILFSSNETDNTWLESIKFSNAPNMSGPAADRRPVDIPGNIEPFSKFQSILDGGYYHYAGSMTTPPCSEIVSWFVFDTPAQIGAAQLTYFKSIFADPMNNRPVQALNGRKVVYGSYEKGTQQTGEEAVFLELAAPSLIEQYKQTHKDIYHRKCMPCPYTGDQKTWVGDGRHDAKKYMCVEEPEMVHGKAVISTGWRSCFAAGSDRCQDSCEGFIKSADPDDPFGDIETSIECGTEIKTTDSGYCICDKTKKVGAYPAVPKPYLNCNEACDTDHFAYWRQTSDCKWDGARDIMNDKKGDTEIDHRFGGYCECEDRTKGGHLESTNIKVMKANCDPKTHPYATCTEACEALWAGTLITIHYDGSQDDDSETHAGEITEQPSEHQVPEQQIQENCFYKKETCPRCVLIGGDTAASWKSKALCLANYMICEMAEPVLTCVPID